MKHTLILGPPSSGKSSLAKSIMLAFNNPLYIDGSCADWLESRFIFKDVNENTDLIVIDEVSLGVIHKSMFRYWDLLVVHKQGVKTKFINHPKMIIVAEFDINDISKSILERFNVIRTSVLFSKEDMENSFDGGFNRGYDEGQDPIFGKSDEPEFEDWFKEYIKEIEDEELHF